MNKKIKLGFVSLSLLISGFFISCDSGNAFEGDEGSEVTIDLSGELIQGGQNLLVIDENNPNNYYSRLDSIIIYGYAAQYTLPDSLKDCDLKVIISGKAREKESITSAIVVALHGATDSLYAWNQIQLGNHITQLNNWSNFKDSVMIESAKNTFEVKHIKIFPYKTSGKGDLNVDDLVIKIIKE